MENTVKAKAEIINGRMPIAVVAQVRFGNDKGLSNKELAALYGTTVGKIDDIKKNRNFAYVTQDFRPTQEQVDQGIEWLRRHPKFNEGMVDKPLMELEQTPIATSEEAAVFEAQRLAARGTSVKTKSGDIANGGGGNRKRGRKPKTQETVESTEELVSAEDLLA
jgi:hypothetical protein